MEQKRVSFKVAKAIKEAGYNELCDMYYHILDDEYESKMSLEMTGDGSHSFLNSLNQYRCAAPYVLDVWLWLWRKKGIEILASGGIIVRGKGKIEVKSLYDYPNDPDEAIAAAIEYLVDNDLLKKYG